MFRPAPERVKLLPLWYWLVFLSAVLLLSDVAVRSGLDPQRLADGRYAGYGLRPTGAGTQQEVAERLQMSD